jgi:plastocyanin
MNTKAIYGGLVVAGLVLTGQGCPLFSKTEVRTETPVPPAAEETGTTEAGVGANAGGTVTAPGVNATVGATAAVNVSMIAENFTFSPSTITAVAGQTVNVTVERNEGTHTFTIDGVVNKQLATGASFSFKAPTKPGRYPYYCSIGNHRAMGLEGTLIVE